MNDTGMLESVSVLTADGTAVDGDTTPEDAAKGALPPLTAVTPDGRVRGDSSGTVAQAVVTGSAPAGPAPSTGGPAAVDGTVDRPDVVDDLTGLTPAPGYGMNRLGGEGSDILEQVGLPAEVSADIVLPVHNAEDELEEHIRQLMDFLDSNALLRDDFTWNIVIADDGSTDATWSIAFRLAAAEPTKVRALRLRGRGQSGSGRGHALKLAWGQSRAQVLAYMDIGLSTDIKDVGFLIGSLLVGGADLAVGSRLLGESQVSRSVHRDFISRTYNVMLRSYLGATFHDAQCEFKALTAQAARTLLPLVCDDGLFFDAELLLLAQNAGMLIYEIPVVWEERKEAKFSIADTVQKDLDGMRRMRRTFARGVNAQGRRLPWAKLPCSSQSGAGRSAVGSVMMPRTSLVDIASVSVSSQGSKAQHSLVK